MNQDITSTAKTFRRPVRKLHLEHRNEQANCISSVQICDSRAQTKVPLSSSICDCDNVQINKYGKEHDTCQDDYNLISWHDSLSAGINQTVCASQVTDDWHLYPQELSINSDTQGHDSHACRDPAAHSNPRYQLVQCSSSAITGELKRERSGLQVTGNRLHVSNSSSISTLQLFSSDIVSNQCLLEFEKTAPAVRNHQRLCGFCTEFHFPVCHQAPGESRIAFDLTADLQYNTSFSNFDIYRSSKISNNNGENSNSSDETLKYRKDIREQCKRQHHLKPDTVDKHDTSVKNTFVLQDIDNLGFPSYVLTPQGTTSGENQHSGNIHGRTHRNRHRQKHEIGQNRVSENKATTLRLNRSLTSDALQPGTPNKDFLKSCNSKLCLFSSAVSSHKESPRARFERDRAARNNAISRKYYPTQSQLEAFSTEPQTNVLIEPNTARSTAAEKSAVFDIESVSSKRLQLKSVAPIQWPKSENVSLSINGNTDIKTSQRNSNLQFSSFTNNHGLGKTIPVSKKHISDTSNQDQFYNSTFTSQSVLLNASYKSSVDAVLPGTFCPTLKNNCVPTLLRNEEDHRNTNEETLTGDSERVNTTLSSSTVRSPAPLPESNQFLNKSKYSEHTTSCVQDLTRNAQTRINFKAVFYSKDSINSDQSTSRTTYTHQIVPQAQPIVSNKPYLQIRPADSSCAPLDYYNIPPHFEDAYTCQNKNSNEINRHYLPHLSHQQPLGFVRDVNAVHSFASNIDTSDISREFTIENTNSDIEHNLNPNIRQLHQHKSQTSVKHRPPENATLNQITPFVNKVISEKNAHSSHACNYSHAENQLQHAECQTDTCSVSVKEKVSCKCDSNSSSNIFVDVSQLGNYTHESHHPVSSSDSRQNTNLAEKNPVIGSYSSCTQINSSGKRMLASKGLRIYDYVHDFNSVLNPAKSSHLKSAASTFQWEGTTYLILPTVLDSLMPKDTSNIATVGNRELLTHRSASDSGTAHSFINNSDGCNRSFTTDNDKDLSNEDNLLSMSSRHKRLSFKQRSLSVDALCTEDDSNFGLNLFSDSHNISEDNINAGRGYVEWKTCSGWLRKPHVETDQREDSRGYVDWDTIWTPGSPRVTEGKNDEHLYDCVGEYKSYSSHEHLTDLPSDELHSLAVHNETSSRESFPNLPVNIKTPSREGFDNSPVTTITLSREVLHDLPITNKTPLCENLYSLSLTNETPPALPERTYINRLKKCNSSESPPSCLEVHRSSQHRRHHHHHHHDINNLRKHHNHYHHKHTSSNKEKHQLSTSSNPAWLTSSAKSTSSVLIKQCNMSGSSDNSPKSPDLNHDSNASGELNNYATVHKLRGYRFNNITTKPQRPVLLPRNKTTVNSENYCHLAPLASKQNMISLQTGDILDYIDGLHDFMSPKSRENIYILLNNKQTRAKFSESLEIESRLLSKGLISGSSVCETLEDSLEDKRSIISDTTQNFFNFEVPKRKGVFATVSSTYV